MTKPFSTFFSRSASAGAAGQPDENGLTAAERTAVKDLHSVLASERSALADTLVAGDGLGDALRNGGVLLDDALLRLLRHNDCDPAAAAKQLRATVEWRAKTNVGAIPADAMRGVPAGCPIAIIPSAVGRHRVTLAYGSSRHFNRRAVNSAAHATAVARTFDALLYAADGARASAAVAVLDFDGLTISNVDLVTTRSDVIIFLQHYPEAFVRILFVSSPRFIYHFYKLITPLLNERTIERIVWCDTPQHVTTELDKWFSRDQIPVWLGGNERKTPLDLACGNGESDLEQKLIERYARKSPH